MNFEFADDELERLYCDPTYNGHWTQEIVKAFRSRMQFIAAATDERAFYGMKSLRFEKLQGKRKDQRSMRLNDQYRLILCFRDKGENRTIIIESIEDYH
jgi:proteic killer suppression protein